MSDNEIKSAMPEQGEIVIYQATDGVTKIDVRTVAIPEYEYTPEEGSVDVTDGEELEEEVDDNV